jgi:hypothetical protein
VQFNIPPRTKAQVPSALPATISALSADDQRKAAKHREIARRYDRPRRKGDGPSIVALRRRDLEAFFGDQYGKTFPDDDAGRDDLAVLLHHVSKLGDPRATRDSAARWCPWLTDVEYTAMLDAIARKPRRWSADSLAHEIGLDRATRTRLGITTIGATDFNKAQRTKRRKKHKNADKRARRAESGAAPHAASAECTKPWEALGISRRTYYRKQANGTLGTDTGTAAYYVMAPQQCHTTEAGASPSGESADAALSPACNTVSTVRVERVTKRDSAFAGRLGSHWIEISKNPFQNAHWKPLAKDIWMRAA